MSAIRVVTEAAELLDAVESAASEIEIQGTISGIPTITLKPGVSLGGGELEFGAKGVRLSSSNTLEGVTVRTADDDAPGAHRLGCGRTFPLLA